MKSKLDELLEKLIESLPDSSRKVLQKYLMTVVVYADAKMRHRQTRNSERIQWARVVVQAASSSGGLLKDANLDELRARIDALEK